MTYHIIKSSRLYEGKPYCGASSDHKPAGADDLDDAISLAERMLRNNPVGWDIYNSENGAKVASAG